VYVDFDLFVLQPLHALRNMIAKEREKGMVNGALLTFDAGHPFLSFAMTLFPTNQNDSIFHSAGPSLQSRALVHYSRIHTSLTRLRTHPAPSDAVVGPFVESAVNIYMPHAFFRHDWEQAASPKYWHRAQYDEAELNRTMTLSYSFHVWTAVLTPAPVLLSNFNFSFIVQYSALLPLPLIQTMGFTLTAPNASVATDAVATASNAT
jgi:hypothetical protein